MIAPLLGFSIEDLEFKLGLECEVLIATPRMLINLLENKCLVLSRCNYIVMDEADRITDMGFESDVHKVGYSNISWSYNINWFCLDFGSLAQD